MWKDGRYSTEEYRRYWNMVMHHRRRVQGGPALTKKMIQRVYEDNIKFYGTLTCYLCEKEVCFGEDSIDHKVPLSRGGTNAYSNLAIAHRSCNCKKNSKTKEEYDAHVI